MRARSILGGISIAAIGLIVLGRWYFGLHPMSVLAPAGTVGLQERQLIFFAAGLSLFVVVPVFTLTFWIAWRYRASNHHAAYSPDWDHSRWVEGVWWLIPSILITILSITTWHATHTLDPRRSLASSQKPLTVQVVALQWKWLFIYPDQHVATVNQLMLPVNRPVHFIITADAPMNSFWIPQLGGQIYAMPGMTTNLNLMADRTGNYHGSSANISGQGFASMDFTAKALSRPDWQAWLQTARQSKPQLTTRSYDQLAQPGRLAKPKTYGRSAPGIYNRVMMKFMMPGADLTQAGSGEATT